MKIIEGRYYLTRDGQKVGPMRLIPNGWGFNDMWPWTDRTVKPDGLDGIWCTDGFSHTMPLIAEWTDTTDIAATKTTDKAYWPWAYVSVEAMNGEGETMFVRAAPSDGMVALDEYAYLDPPQARALAAALIAYADQAE